VEYNWPSLPDQYLGGPSASGKAVHGDHQTWHRKLAQPHCPMETQWPDPGPGPRRAPRLPSYPPFPRGKAQSPRRLTSHSRCDSHLRHPTVSPRRLLGRTSTRSRSSSTSGSSRSRNSRSHGVIAMPGLRGVQRLEMAEVTRPPRPARPCRPSLASAACGRSRHRPRTARSRRRAAAVPSRPYTSTARRTPSGG
jgi:hypothetical protein